MKTCPVCQQTLTDTAKFCYYCGASLLDPAPEPPVPPIADDPAPEIPSEPTETIPNIEPAPEHIPEITPEPEPVPEPEPEPVPVIVPEPTPKSDTPESPKEQPRTQSAAAPAVERKPESIVISTDSRSLMTTAGYFFTTILFHIPVIGLIFMIVWGCGKTKNISRKRFSLAFLIMRLICYIVLLSAAVFALICFSGIITALWEAVKPILLG